MRSGRLFDERSFPRLRSRSLLFSARSASRSAEDREEQLEMTEHRESVDDDKGGEGERPLHGLNRTGDDLIGRGSDLDGHVDDTS